MKPHHLKRVNDYLRVELDLGSELSLTLVKQFDTHPLHGPGVGEVYTFSSALGADTAMPYFAVVASAGPTNYYPCWGLTPEDIWAVHIATEFYLFMGVESLPASTEYERFAEEASALVRSQLQTDPIGPPLVETVYRLKAVEDYPEEYHAVGKVTHSKGTSSFVVGDIEHELFPPQLPGHVVWRLHFGRQILAE